MSEQGPAPAGAPQLKSLNCPNCGAGLTLRTFGQAVTVVCEGCHSILDAQDSRLRILQTFRVATREDPPLIPLGTRGTIRGTKYEAIGFHGARSESTASPTAGMNTFFSIPTKGSDT